MKANKRVIATVGTGLVAIATTLIIVFAAIVPIPEFAPLQPGQQSGYVAYLPDDEEEPQSIHIVSLGSLTRVTADVGREVAIVGWHSDGHLVVQNWTGDRYVLIDPATGVEVGSVDSGDGDVSWQSLARVYRDDGSVAIEHSEAGGSASFRAPESYDLGDAVTMGFDRIVFVDELGRVAVTYLGEDTEPVLVASDAGQWGGLAARP